MPIQYVGPEQRAEIRSLIRDDIDQFRSELERFTLFSPMQRLDVKDGDTLVVFHPQRLRSEAIKGLQEAIQKITSDFGLNVRMLVLDEGMRLGVLRKEDAAP